MAVALVGAHIDGGTVRPSVGTAVFDIVSSYSVTAGNVVIVTALSYDGSTNISPVVVTKQAGTCTIGTIVIDKTSTSVNLPRLHLAIARVPITGSGTLTLRLDNTTGTDCFFLYSTSEWSYNVALSVDGTPTSSTGNATTGTTGTVNNTNGGLIVATEFENTSSTFTRTWSDTSLFNSTNTSFITGIAQYKAATGVAAALTSGFGGTGPWDYDTIAVAYIDVSTAVQPHFSRPFPFKPSGARSPNGRF